MSEESFFEEIPDAKSKKSAAQTKKSTTLSKKSMLAQVEHMTHIFSKPIEERERSDKEKIVQFLRLGVPFLADVQLPLLHLLSDKLETVAFREGEISNSFFVRKF